MGRLSEVESNRVYERMVQAEVRSFYYGELASRYSKRKQLLAGTSFFLSSAAAATIVSQLPTLIPIVASVTVALANAYSIAVGLDRKVLILSKLHSQWSRISSDAEHLWVHWYENDAEAELVDLVNRSREASETGTTDAPYEPQTLRKWEDYVFKLRGLTTAVQHEPASIRA